MCVREERTTKAKGSIDTHVVCDPPVKSPRLQMAPVGEPALMNRTKSVREVDGEKKNPPKQENGTHAIIVPFANFNSRVRIILVIVVAHQALEGGHVHHFARIAAENLCTGAQVVREVVAVLLHHGGVCVWCMCVC